MNKIFSRIFLFFSILWGVGYPLPFRFPIYILISPLIFLLSSGIKDKRLINLLITFSGSFRDFICSKNLIFLIPIVTYTFLWETSNFLYLCSIFLFIFVMRFYLKYEDLGGEDWIYKTLIFSILVNAVSLLFVGSFSEYVPASPGLYPEPSNLGFTLGPILGLLTRRKKYTYVGLTLMLFFLIFFYSKSLLIGYVFALLLSGKFNSKIKSKHLSIAIIFFISILILMKAFFMVRIMSLNENEIDFGIYGSSLVWIYWLKNSIIYLQSNPLGLGPFGWLDNGAEMHIFIPECNYNVICKYSGELITSLNQRDMSNAVAFGISTFGCLFPAYLYILLNRICKNTKAITENYNQLDPISILLISYICVYSFRWTGFTAGPLIGLLCLMPSGYSKIKLDKFD